MSWSTPAFIGDAKEESVNLLLELAQLKEEGRIGRIAAMGCLTQRYLKDLEAEMPEVDLMYGKFDWNRFVEDLPDARKDATRAREWERTLTTPPALRIS